MAEFFLKHFCWEAFLQDHLTFLGPLFKIFWLKGEKAGRKFSRAPGYQISPNYFQKFKQMPAAAWAQKMLCIILCPIGEQFLLSSFRELVHDGYCLDHGLFGLRTKEMHAVRKRSVSYKIPIWFQNTVCQNTKDAFPKIQAWTYNRYSPLNRSRFA